MMKQIRQFTGIIEREGDGYAALCPELDIASQGDSVEEARYNLKEALELFFECAEISEIERRLRTNELYHPELKMGTLRSIIRQSGLSRSEFEVR